MHEAAWYTKDTDSVVCTLCPHTCRITDGKAGKCGVRVNSGGTLYSRNYASVTAASVDPVEKKPLYHYYPGAQVFSIGTFGCNMQCPYCQNWQISQSVRQGDAVSSSDSIQAALDKNSTLIAYTYSEPIVWYEYVIDCAEKALGSGLKNIMVTNGFINLKPLEKLIPYIGAWNIDLKTFSDETYTKIQGARLKPVLETITKTAEHSHVEITTLIVTGINDTMDEMRSIADWIASVSKAIPWHISRYFPSYNYNKTATSEKFMLDVYEMAREKLDYVYCGNMTGRKEVHNTCCPDCNTLLIERLGYRTNVTGIKEGKCITCGKPFDGHI